MSEAEVSGTEQGQSLEERLESFDPGDPDALASLEADAFSGSEGEEASANIEEGGTAEAVPSEPKQDDKLSPVETPPATEGASPDTPETTTPVIKTRDGNHEIPYAVLEGTREQLSTAEALIRQQATRIGELTQAAQDAATTPETPVVTNPEAAPMGLTEDQLETLEGISPEMAEAIKVQAQMLASMQKDMVTFKEETQREKEQREQAQNAAAAREVNLVIDTNPDLLAWRTEASRVDNPDRGRWEAAIEMDNRLRNMPQWQDKPIAERFAQAAIMVKTMFGEPMPVPEPTLSPAELKAAADAKLAELPGAVPGSLSELPGGAAPAQTDLEALENVSSFDLAQKFENMSVDQMDAYLARMGG